MISKPASPTFTGVPSVICLTFRVGLLLTLLAACSFEPQPSEVELGAVESELVTLVGAKEPAEDIYWTFFSHPQAALPAFESLSSETAQFRPRLPGEYIVDRWGVSGPAGIWLDRFIVLVTATPAAIEIRGAERSTLGNSVLFRANLVDEEVDTPNLAFEWRVESSSIDSVAVVEPGANGNAAFTPDVAATYTIRCTGVHEYGRTLTASATLEVTLE